MLDSWVKFNFHKYILLLIYKLFLLIMLAIIIDNNLSTPQKKTCKQLTDWTPIHMR